MIRSWEELAVTALRTRGRPFGLELKEIEAKGRHLIAAQVRAWTKLSELSHLRRSILFGEFPTPS
ncbi:MAG TPA: hypothetical protein VJS64_18330, partial [Pyrinomonadaceae bacterium]|nr:hypothetical protein [Pyrinomonadaceae bacterium]